MKNNLSHYISELLYRYDCVIIPGFGGFVAQIKNAEIDRLAHAVHPPKKALSFNALLIKNDGVLVNFIAEENDTTYKEAKLWIAKEVGNWTKLMKFEALHLPKIGVLKLGSENQMIFEPEDSTNFLTSSFGLSSVHAKEMTKTISIAPKRNSYLKYAAVFALGIAVAGGFGIKQFKKTYTAALTNQMNSQKKVQEAKIEKATFAIDAVLPEVKLTIKKEAEPLKYFIIAGAFREEANAKKQVRSLKKQGYQNAEIIGQNKWKLHQVSFEGFSSREEADKTLVKIRKSGSKDAWIYELK